MEKMEIQGKALQLVKEEKTSWEEGIVYVTDNIAFSIKNLIRQCRKNYYSIFDNPNDSITGRRKTYIPMTESTVESVVKNTDIDTKDINFRAKKPDSIGTTRVVRSVVRNGLDEIIFGDKLDDMIRNLAIDGTVVWKTFEREEDGKVVVDVTRVDLLNFYIDPNARSIFETPAVIERSIMSVADVKKMKDWINTDGVVGQTNIPAVGDTPTTSGSGKFVEVYERWGTMPKSLITGLDEDDDKDVTGRIVCSLDEEGKIFLIEEVDSKPYEEVWYTRVPNRWHGRGVAEKLVMLQSYLNTIVNIRKNRAYLTQIGLFKIKKNRGITPQQLNRLPTSGAILVDSMDDIEQFTMQEASAASYQDENNIKDWARNVTQTWESVTGETMPASSTATSAALSSKAGQSYFVFVKEGIGLFLERWIKRHYMPALMKNTSPAELVLITGDPDELEEFDRMIVNAKAGKILKEMNESGTVVDNIAFKNEIERKMKKRKMQGAQRFAKITKKINPLDYDTKVSVTNEDLDKGAMLQNLSAILNVAPEYKDQIIASMSDLMSLNIKKQQSAPVQTGANVPSPEVNPQEIATRAITNEPNTRL